MRRSWRAACWLFSLAWLMVACGQPATADYLPTTAVPAVPTAPPAALAAPARLSAKDLAPETVSVKGKADAPLLIVEYSDYQCPFCQRYVSSALPQIQQQYIDTGKVRYEFRDFPLSSIHPQAQLAAEAARCAGEQGNYWGMHDALFTNQSFWEGDDARARTTFSDFASKLGLDSKAFNTCLESGRYTALIESHSAEGRKLGVAGTPSFLIGSQFLAGAQPFEVFQSIIEQELARR